MAKKKSKAGQFTLKPWCWYCEREFEDEKVLLQHQKAKHFKCTKCPRKLNTAGGLAVHSQQVHKCEPDKLTNTLPGRDGYEIEIFGMEGVPAKDYADYRAKKESEWGVSVQVMLNNAKRPRTRYLPLSEYDLQTALEKHKRLMSGSKQDPPAAPKPFVPPTFALPPGGFPPAMPPFAGAPPFPPPGFPPAAFPPGFSPALPAATSPYPPTGAPPPAQAPAASTPGGVSVQPSKDGVIWPDFENSPAEKRAQQPRYRYTSPEPDTVAGQKRKAAADFL